MEYAKMCTSQCHGNQKLIYFAHGYILQKKQKYANDMSPDHYLL